MASLARSGEKGHDEKTHQWTASECISVIQTFQSYIPFMHEHNLSETKIWKLVLSELGAAFSSKFTQEDLMNKVEQLKSTYRKLNDSQGVSVDKTRPLMAAVGELVRIENEFETNASALHYAEVEEANSEEDPEYVPDEDDMNKGRSSKRKLETSEEASAPVRWSDSETRQLLTAYKKYLPRLLSCGSHQAKGAVWAQIILEVKLRGREVSRTAARGRMDSLRIRWKHFNDRPAATRWNGYKRNTRKEGLPWVFFDEMSSLVRLEKYLEKKVAANVPLNLIDVDEVPITEGTETEESGDCPEPPAKKLKPLGHLEMEGEPEDTEEPIWFTLYRDAAKRRHGEVMALKHKLLDILEEVLQQM